MASPSKEDNVLELILENSPLKEWQFGEIARAAKVTKLVANKWIKKFVAEGLLARIKKKGKFPHYSVGSNNMEYYSRKRVYALEQLHKSGLGPKLMSLNEAKTVILFGSSMRGDWYKDSDVDIFIYGNIPDFDKKLYETRLRKTIELHVFRNKAEIEAVRTGLIRNVVNGYVLKGQLQDFAEIN